MIAALKQPRGSFSNPGGLLSSGKPTENSATGLADAFQPIKKSTFYSSRAGSGLGSGLENLVIALSFDYAQLELRWLAEISDDKLLISQFQLGQDIHSVIGSTLTGWPVKRIENDESTRRLVKNVNFSIVYGVNRDGLYDYIVRKIRSLDGADADLTGITPTSTKRLYDLFFKKYTSVAAYIERERNNAETKGYVETLFGFRRRIRKQETDRKSFWGNQAINTPVQSGAHQLVLIALALLHVKPRTYDMLCHSCVAEIHDQLLFFVKLDDLSIAYAQARQLLEQEVVKYTLARFKYKMRVPLVAEAKVGFCFGSLVKYHGEPWREILPIWRATHLEIERTVWEKMLAI